MRIGFLGPPGTVSHEALGPADPATELVPQPSLHAAVLAVHEGVVDRALVPIENSLEGAVNATLDTLALATEDVVIVGERLHPVHHSLLAAAPVELARIRTVISHPQASAQCARFLREQLPGAAVVPADSTADAVRRVGAKASDATAAALGTRLAARLYGCVVLREDVEDSAGNETRFVWLARAEGSGLGFRPPVAGNPTRRPAESVFRPPVAGNPTRRPAESVFRPPVAGNPTRRPAGDVTCKTALLFWGAGSAGPGWLVRCLAEFASRDVNLTRIESRPRRQGIGEYIFFLDLAGSEADAAVADAIAGLRSHAEVVRVLGSFPAA